MLQPDIEQICIASALKIQRHQDISHSTKDEAEALEALRQMLDQLSSARSKMCQ